MVIPLSSMRSVAKVAIFLCWLRLKFVAATKFLTLGA